MGTTHLKIAIDGMSCASCVGRVERALAGIDGVGAVAVNLADGSAQMDIAEGVDFAHVATALEGTGYPLRTQSAKLTLTSMSCASCVGRVDRALSALPGVLDVNVNLASESATVSYAEGTLSPRDLRRTPA
jgi:Cu+-exporting ATPase